MASVTPKKKGPYPKPGIVWGSEGTEPLTFTGPLPLSVTGPVTGNVYKWSPSKPTRQVDKRDVEGIVQLAGGVKMFSELKPERKKKEEKDATG